MAIARIHGPTKSIVKITAPSTGNVASVDIQVKDKAGKSVSSFDLIHTKKMHLIGIDLDKLTMKFHEHPVEGTDGTFHAKVPLTGHVAIFDEYDPKGALKQTIDRSEFGTASAGGGQVAWDFATRTKTVDGLTFKLTGATLMSGMAMPLTVQVTDRAGHAVTPADWLAAKGHAFAARQGAPELYHFHPNDSSMHMPAMGGMPGMGGHTTAKPGEISFHAQVNKPGNYRVFVQVMKPGASTPTTVSFDLKAT